MVIDHIQNTLHDSWACADLDDDTDTSLDPIATHDSGSELYVHEVGRKTLVNISQTISFGNLEVDVVTNGDVFENDQEVVHFADTVCDGIESGELTITGLAFVPHDGDLDSVSTKTVGNTEWRSAPRFADVFALYSDALPSRVEISDVRDEAQDIVDMVYGKCDDIPDSVQTLNSEAESVGKTTIEVFTVTDEDVRISE